MPNIGNFEYAQRNTKWKPHETLDNRIVRHTFCGDICFLSDAVYLPPDVLRVSNQQSITNNQ